MDPVRKTFDKWAKNGRGDLMEKEHGKNVIKILKTISFDKPFLFLDFGCGNGWVIRKISKDPYCKKAVGIDKSKNMILEANKKKKPIKKNTSTKISKISNLIINLISYFQWNRYTMLIR